jgi:SAM-dependent methyltransferase
MKNFLSRLLFIVANGPKYLLNWSLMRIFKFDAWHVSTIASRPYCVDLANYINNNISTNHTVVEVGCGLGETLASIKCMHRYGIDTSKEVLNAAKLKHLFRRIEFIEGSFDAVQNMEIDYLIAANFLHDFSSEQVQKWIAGILSNNHVKNIILDELSDRNYFCLHNWDSILPREYKLNNFIDNNYTYGRVIKIFSLTADNE